MSAETDAGPRGSAGVEQDAVRVRPLLAAELPEADRIMRLAFGTYLRLPEPLEFMGDGDYVEHRWTVSPSAAFAAELGGRLVGSNFATRWGSFGFVGPLSVDPAHWERGVASRLMTPVMERLNDWGVATAGLFTFAHSPRHLGLYQKFGFRPGALSLVMDIAPDRLAEPNCGWRPYSALDAPARAAALARCRQICAGVEPGLDLESEIAAVHARGTGETLLAGDDPPWGFAVCHSGPGSEAGSGACHVKFAAVSSARQAPARFLSLLRVCGVFARRRRAGSLTAGVSAARTEAYEIMLSAGFRIGFTGVTMHRPAGTGFCRPGAYVVDDWR